MNEILREIEASRAAVFRDFDAARRSLDFKARAQQAIISKPVPWLGSAAAIGWFLAGRGKRRRNRARGAGKGGDSAPAKSRGLLGILFALVRLMLPVVQPALSALAARHIANLAGKPK